MAIFVFRVRQKTTLGLGLMGLNKLFKSKNKEKMTHASLHDYCARIAFGWPLNYKKRRFRYLHEQYKEAGIFIANTDRELYITPAFPGQIIDIQKPSKHQNRYTIVIKHPCNNLTTIYGNIRIPSEAKNNPENLIGLYVTKTDVIGLIDPDKELFFCVKQLQAGKDASRINYEFQQIAKHTARLLRYDHQHGQKIDIGGLSLQVLSPTRSCKELMINKKIVSKIYFLDPLQYLPKHPLN